MPRGPHDSQGLSTTRSPVSARRPTASWPSTCGKDTRAVSGLSRAPFSRICFTSDPHSPEKVVSTRTQSFDGSGRLVDILDPDRREAGDEGPRVDPPADGRGRLAGQAVPENERLHVDLHLGGSPTYQGGRQIRQPRHAALLRRECRARYSQCGPAGQPNPLTNQMNVLLILPMGRIAGVTAEQTRERLLRAAADVFAERGYDGTRVADIAAAAGVSNGAMYAHFASKAELLTGALRAHGQRLLADLFQADPTRSITEMLLVIGQWLPRRRDARGYLIVEALVAARRDEAVARPMRDYVGERADWLADLMRVAQA